MVCSHGFPIALAPLISALPALRTAAFGLVAWVPLAAFRGGSSRSAVAISFGEIAPPAVSSKPAGTRRPSAASGWAATVLDLARIGRIVLVVGTLDGHRFLSGEGRPASSATDLASGR